MRFELLEHPADVGFRAYADILPEVFAACAEALVSLILDASAVEPAQQIPISADGIDRESLLVNWLNEILYFVDSRRLAFIRFEITSFSATRIEATAFGERRDPQKHPARLIVKAVTYHQLKIRQTGDSWSADVYVDV